VPTGVTCTVTLELSKCTSAKIRSEWDELREGDIVFLVTVTVAAQAQAQAQTQTQPPSASIAFVRCAEVGFLRDGSPAADREAGGSGSGSGKASTQLKGTKRYLLLRLDPAQYALDEKNGHTMHQKALNLIVRRDPRESNFKAMLGTLRDMIATADKGATGTSTGCLVPQWIKNTLLGIGDPNETHHR